MDRRTSLKWMLAAAAIGPLGVVRGAPVEARRYGSDPNLLAPDHPGELWPLTLTPAQRKLATVLSDIIIPADATSPSASAVGVVDFIDEWISAPYPTQQHDRKLVLDGFVWIDKQSKRRFSKPTHELSVAQLHEICDEICYLPRAKPQHVDAAKFFARYRDLTAGGFYTTPAGRKDLQYVGNVALARFDGPPIEVLKKVGLA